jgi:hypothetical protein
VRAAAAAAAAAIVEAAICHFCIGQLFRQIDHTFKGHLHQSVGILVQLAPRFVRLVAHGGEDAFL